MIIHNSLQNNDIDGIHPTGGEMLTQQSMKDETDINNIIGKFMKTGILTQPGATRKLMFGDTTSDSYHDMVNKIADAELAFTTLPSKIRDRFLNDPYQLLRFLENPENQKEAIKLGLIVLPEPQPELEVPVTSPVYIDPEANPGKKPA